MSLQHFFSDYVLFSGYILVVLATIAAIGGPILNAISNPKTIAKSIIGIAVFVLIYFIGKAVSSSEVTPLYEKFNISASLSGQIGALLFVMYALFVLAILTIVVNEITNFFK